MKLKLKYIILAGILLLIVSSAISGDNFEAVKEKLKAANIVRLDILIEVASQVFGDTETDKGQIYFSKDGRYNASINDDIYLFDGEYMWEYSAENNQATKKKIEEDQPLDSRLSFFKNIDDYYKTNVKNPNWIYQLVKLDEDDEALPNVIVLYLKPNRPEIENLEYYDLNNDLNRIIIKNTEYIDSTATDYFKINLPDSVEIIDLP